MQAADLNTQQRQKLFLLEQDPKSGMPHGCWCSPGQVMSAVRCQKDYPPRVLAASMHAGWLAAENLQSSKQLPSLSDSQTHCKGCDFHQLLQNSVINDM